METIYSKDVKDRRLCGFVFYSFLLVAINKVTNIPILLGFQSTIAILQWLLFFAWFVYLCFDVIWYRSGKMMLYSFCLFSVLYVISIVQSLFRNAPIDILFKHDILWTFASYLPVGLAAFSIRNHKLLYNIFFKYSFLITMCCVAIFLDYMSHPFGYSYDMTFGYILLLPTLLHFSWYNKHRKFIIVLVIALIETAMMLIYGSRGVVISLSTYFILHFFLFYKYKKYGKRNIIVMALAGSLLYFGLPRINDYLESKNIYSRTLMSLSNRNSESSSGRNDHWKSGIATIIENPILGYGLGGYYYQFHKNLISLFPDEEYAYSAAEGSFRIVTANYSGTHSGFLEMMLFFGIFLGFPLGCWIILSIYKIRHIEDVYLFELVLIMYSIYIITNMIVGGGIHTKPGSAFYLFIIVGIYQHRFANNSDTRNVLL